MPVLPYPTTCRNEFKRAGVLNFPPLGVTVLDSFRLFCQQEPRSLGAAVSFYLGRSHAGAAHTALADAQATLDVLIKQVSWLLSC
jgi:DNA polymerase III epsilon subunit-like protein